MFSGFSRWCLTVLLIVTVLGLPAVLWADDPSLAQKSTLNAIKTKGKIQVCSDIPYPPFEFKDTKGNDVGFDIDLARLMAKFILGDSKKVEILATAFDVIRAEMNRGRCDIVISGMTITLERQLEVNFAKGYYTTGQVAGVSKTRQPNLANYTQLNDARMVVSVQLATTGEIAARKRFAKAQIKTFDTFDLAVAEVVAGRADAVIFDEAGLIVEAGKFKDKMFLCCPVGKATPLTKEFLGAAIRKGDPDFLAWLDLFVDQIQTVVTVDEALATEFGLDKKFIDEPVYDALIDKWFVKFVEQGAK